MHLGKQDSETNVDAARAETGEVGPMISLVMRPLRSANSRHECANCVNHVGV